MQVEPVCIRTSHTSIQYEDGSSAMSDAEQPDAPALTPELWAKVFALVEEVPTIARIAPDHRRNQAEVHQLKLVCKQFKDLHASHPELVQRVYLGDEISARRLPSLLTWLQQSKPSVQLFQSTCGSPLVDAVLAVLTALKHSMKMFFVCHVSTSSVSILAMFTNLEKCSLGHDDVHELDLTPLGQLSRLSRLTLQGCYRQLQHLAGLTQLECIDAKVWDLQEFALTLQELVIHDSFLCDIHAQGLSTYTALTQLVLFNACLVTEDGWEYLDQALSLFPTNIGLLTQLHTFYLSTGPSSKKANVEWVSQLKSLQNLSIFFGYRHRNVIQPILLLTRLTSLSLGCCGWMPSLGIVIDWHKLPALQHFSMHYSELQLEALAGLLGLKNLRTVSLVCCTINHDVNFAHCICHLDLANLHPHAYVKLSLDDLIVSERF